MTTSKPFATISYNSEDFLISKLSFLLCQDFIDFFAYIIHQPEEDELKAHIHLYIVPSKLCNTKTILGYFEEKVEDNDKPLKCMPARSADFGNWYMYCLHDKAYLASKGQMRSYFYVKEDFVVSDSDFFNDSIAHIDRSKWVGTQLIVDAVERDLPFHSMVCLGQVPVQLIRQYEYMYQILQYDKLERNGRETHTPKCEN